MPGAYVKDDEECPRDFVLDVYRSSAAERQEVLMLKFSFLGNVHRYRDSERCIFFFLVLGLVGLQTFKRIGVIATDEREAWVRVVKRLVLTLI